MDSKLRGEIFEKGIKVVDENGSPVKVNRFIAAGGQGEVYHVTYKGNDYTLKWYCKNPDDVIGGIQYETIRNICKMFLGDCFVLPQFLVTEEEPEKGKKFGYLTSVIPEGYYDMEDFLRPDFDNKAVRFKSFSANLTAGINIANAMRELHLKGLIYTGIDPHSIVICPETGDIRLIDSDTISVAGSKCHVIGMVDYMAPELVRCKNATNPSIDTDRYSLAVILYRLFCIDHPMEGKAWEKYPLCTEKVEEHLYAIKPVFHFDPDNDENRPSECYAPNAEIRWRMLPVELRKLFITVFTEGIDNPGKRPVESEWIAAILNAKDRLVITEEPNKNNID